MIFLAVWDLFILILIILCLTLPTLFPMFIQTNAYKNAFRFGVPIIQISITGSIYSTLALTIDRLD